MVDDTISTGILHLDVNESPEEAQESASAMLDNIILQPGTRTTCHHMPTRTSSRPCSTFQQLQQQNVGTPVNKNNLTDKQRRSIIDTRWAISERPSSSSSSKTTLKARFCGKGFTQEVSNANVETFAATQHHLLFFFNTASFATGK